MLDFGTKAETLERLRPQIKQGHIYPSVFFTVGEWTQGADSLLAKIQSSFPNQLLIVRSSSIAEDSFESAMAGVHDSVANVASTDRKALSQAISTVIESYQRKRASHADQVLIQPMLTDVSMSGVLFTRDINSGAPYYVINYDDTSGKTDTITSGKGDSSRTLVVYRNFTAQDFRSTRFQKLLAVVKEIESLVNPDLPLDIEFAVSKDEEHVYIFQVRPITVGKRWDPTIESKITASLAELHAFLKHNFAPKAGILGRKGIFGDMPDWNPAEIIGPTPQHLAVSLYRHLITDSIWAEGRAAMGYRDLSGIPLMVLMAGRPYIEIRNSFNSFLPATLPDDVGEKLVTAWVQKLEANPELHDKIEFEVATTTFTFDFDTRSAEDLKACGLNANEIKIFRDSLWTLTHGIVSQATLETWLGKIETLGRNRERVLSDTDRSDRSLLEKAGFLLQDCRVHGTLPFAVLARCAFIAEEFLRSLIRLGALKAESVRAFKATIKTVTSTFLEEVQIYQSGQMPSTAFFAKYGHLRPGTYDILAHRYDQEKELFAPKQKSSATHSGSAVNFSFSKEEEQRVAEVLATHPLFKSTHDLFQFIREAIAAREYSKFEFTKNLSEALELVAAWGTKHGMPREEMAHIPIFELFDTLIETKVDDTESWLRGLSQKYAEQHKIAQAVRLPFLIRESSDIHIVPLLKSKPNFVTQKRVQEKLFHLDGSTSPDPAQLQNKIILIEGADPGYDWIFAHQIKGLITKFGGANSHMAIRCAELEIPAAIGCGDQLFQRFSASQEVCLDCGIGLITVIV